MHGGIEPQGPTSLRCPIQNQTIPSFRMSAKFGVFVVQASRLQLSGRRVKSTKKDTMKEPEIENQTEDGNTTNRHGEPRNANEVGRLFDSRCGELLILAQRRNSLAAR